MLGGAGIERRSRIVEGELFGSLRHSALGREFSYSYQSSPTEGHI